MASNPYKEIAPYEELGDDAQFMIIERSHEDESAHWGDHFLLIENVLNRDEDVANCAVEFDGQSILVVLSGDTYTEEDLIEIDTRLRLALGKVAFHFRSEIHKYI